MIMVVAGVQTDTAELVCTVTGRRSLHARRERKEIRDEEPLLLPKIEAYVTHKFLCRDFNNGLNYIRITASRATLIFSQQD